MAYQVFVGDRQTVEDRLNGTIVIGPYPSTGLPIGGLTLILASPAVTITFTGSAGEVRTVDQIIADIQAQAASITTTKRVEQNAIKYSNSGDGRPIVQVNIAMRLDAGITIDKDGTANTLLRLDTDADTAHAGAVDPADIVGFSVGQTQGHLAVVINLS